MKLVKNLRAAILAMTLCSGAAAQADVLTFTGSAFAQATPQALGSCPVFHSAVLAGPNNGTSSLGSFDYTSNSCVTPGGPVNGTFGIDFSATNGIFGTLNGTNTALGAGLFSPAFTYTILGGTGGFLGSTGMFLGTGSINGPLQQLSLNFAGTINAPAVPEPATWAMMLMGFAGIGFAMRRPRRVAVPHIA